MFLLFSFPLKAILEYMHVKTYGGKGGRPSNYLFAFPIIDAHKSIYKVGVNSLVFYQYLMLGIALLENWSFLIEIWQMWDRMP